MRRGSYVVLSSRFNYQSVVARLGVLGYMAEDSESGALPLEAGDVVLSFPSWFDLDTAMKGDHWLSDRDFYGPQESARILLTVSHFIESLVTKERLVFFGWDLENPFDKAPELPLRMFPIQKVYPEFVSELSRSDPMLLSDVKSVLSEYIEYSKRQVSLDTLSTHDPEMVKAEGHILMGDMFRAQYYGIPFSPTPIESGACLYSIARRNLKRSDTSRAAIRLIESARTPLATITNDRMDAQIFDLRVPAIFAAVARNANDFQDLLRVALQMRQTKEAQAFREWAREVDSDRNLASVSTSLAEIQGLSDELAKGIEEKNREVQVQLGVSFIGSFQVTIPFRLPQKRTHHLTFLKSLFSESCKVERLDQEIRRIFGAPIGEAAVSLNELKRLG